MFGVHKVLENYSVKGSDYQLVKKNPSAWSWLEDCVIQWKRLKRLLGATD
jgi:hypothetical protein